MGKEINHETLRKVFRIYHDAGKPLYIKGATGIGKSFAIKEEARDIAKVKGREFFDWNRTTSKEKHELLTNPDKAGEAFIFADVRISQRDPCDMRGLPSLNGKDFVEWKNEILFQVCALPNIAGIVFMDELNLAAPSVQAACYSIILDKAIGEISLNKDVYIAAAGNRQEDKANVFDTAAPLNNRFGHYTLKKPTEKEFTEWAMENGVDGRIVVFLNVAPSHLHKFNADSDEEAFPTHRSWTAVSDLIRGLDDPEDIELVAAGQIGPGTAKEFASHLKMRDKMDISALLKNPKKMADIKEVDKIYCVVSALVEKYKSKEDVLDKAMQISEYMPQEFAVFMMRLMKASNLKNIKHDVQKCQTWPKVAKVFGKYMMD